MELDLVKMIILIFVVYLLVKTRGVNISHDSNTRLEKLRVRVHPDMKHVGFSKSIRFKNRVGLTQKLKIDSFLTRSPIFIRKPEIGPILTRKSKIGCFLPQNQQLLSVSGHSCRVKLIRTRSRSDSG